jgi:hypothetical protein
VQFRPVASLAQLVKPFADRQGLGLNEAFKDLASLAIVGLDVRYFDLVSQLAQAIGGTNAFSHGCLQLFSAMKGAALAGRPLSGEPERSLFILSVVSDSLANKGLTVDTTGLWFLGQAALAGSSEGQPMAPEARTRSAAKKRRSIRKGGGCEPEKEDNL